MIRCFVCLFACVHVRVCVRVLFACVFVRFDCFVCAFVCVCVVRSFACLS